MSAQHVTQNKVLINHMWEGARVCLWQQFHASLERLATKTDILTSTVRIRRWQSQSWHEENLRSYEKAMATSLGGCWAGWANMERWDRERQCGEAASSFFSYGNREWCRGEASSAAEKKGRTSINSGQPTNQPTTRTILPQDSHHIIAPFSILPPRRSDTLLTGSWLLKTAKLIFCLKVVVCYLPVRSALHPKVWVLEPSNTAVVNFSPTTATAAAWWLVRFRSGGCLVNGRVWGNRLLASRRRMAQVSSPIPNFGADSGGNKQGWIIRGRYEELR